MTETVSTINKGRRPDMTYDARFVSDLFNILSLFEEWCLYEGTEKSFDNFIKFVSNELV